MNMVLISMIVICTGTYRAIVAGQSSRLKKIFVEFGEDPMKSKVKLKKLWLFIDTINNTETLSNLTGCRTKSMELS